MSSSSSFNFVFVFCFSALLLVMSTSMQTTSAATTCKKYTNFIKSACNSTRYPKDCYKALSPSASVIKTSPYKLCTVAVSVTVNATYNASSSIASLTKLKGLSPSEKQIISDCADTTSEAIDDLKKSLEAVAHLRGSDHKASEIYDLKTWVSAALTDEYTCADDEFDGQKVSKVVKNTIRRNVLNLAKMTSNCLALFNLLDQ